MNLDLMHMKYSEREAYKKDKLVRKKNQTTGKHPVPDYLKESVARFTAEKDQGVGTKFRESKPITVMLPPHLEAYVRSRANQSGWLRQAAMMLYDLEVSALNDVADEATQGDTSDTSS